MKLYTYANPFTITDELYWSEIGSYPHFCVSQTLVQGLRTHYGRDQFTYLCTIEKIINAIYGDWYMNPEINIAQYVSFSKHIEAMPDGKLKRSFKFNQRSLVDAARFLLTIGVTGKDFKGSLSAEQQAFIQILDSVKSSDYWKFSQKPEETIDGLKTSLVDILMVEVTEFVAGVKERIGITTFPSKDPTDDLYLCLQQLTKKADEESKRDIKRLEHYMALLSNPEVDSIQKVVFHGVHQFTPKIMACVRSLEYAGIEVIFLLNYQPRYRHVYETWEKVYLWVKSDFSDISANDRFDCRLLGECIGNVLEGRRSGDVRLDASIMKFLNKTEFTDLVADVFSTAEKKAKPGADVLASMDEQFYGIHGEEINEILKFYFPKQFGERHFLAYPIGQFILSLYNMWDEQNGLIIDEALLKECFSVNIWKMHGTSTPISIYEKLKAYIADLSSLNDIIKRLNKLMKDSEQLDVKSNNPIWTKFPFFNCEPLDVKYFIGALNDLKKIADELFTQNAGNSIDFRKHFEKLIKIIAMRMKDNRFVSEQERQLVAEVQNRLSSLKGGRSIEGSIDDLRETLHYYLKNESNDNSAHWIVRNLEQIDGGVLLSPYTKANIYHYGLLSDKNMKKLKDEFFPWPLTAQMFESAESGNKDVSIILTSYKEYRHYLRYCIFYGTYYLDSKKKIQFSFIEDSVLDKDIPYYILTLLGLKTVPTRLEYRSERRSRPPSAPIPDKAKVQKQFETITEEDQETYGSCKYRFILSRVLDKSMYLPDAFDCKRLYSLLLFSETWQHNVGIPEGDIFAKMKETSERLKPYFPFFKTVDLIDLENTAMFYLTFRGMIKRGALQSYQPSYIRRKVEFKDQTKSQRNSWIPDEVMRYLYDNDTKEPQQPPEQDSVLCRSCNQRSVCMWGYMQE